MSVLSYIIFVLVAVLAFLLGGVGAYFYYRAKHNESARDLAALKQDLSEQEEDLRRLQNQFDDAYDQATTQAPRDESVEVSRLRRELEQKKKDYSILKQDFDVEIDILRQEVEHIKARKSELNSSTKTATDSNSGARDLALREREAKLTERELGLADRAQGLSVLERDLADRSDELSAREEALADSEKELAGKEQERVDEKQRLTNQAQKLTRLHQELSERERQVGMREAQIDTYIASRLREFEESLIDREQRVREGLASIKKDQEMLVRTKDELAERESRLDDELLGLPTEKFTSRQEAILIKRLKHQNMLQRNELEQVKRLCHRLQLQDEGGAGQAHESTQALDSEIDDMRGDGSSSATPQSLSTTQ